MRAYTHETDNFVLIYSCLASLLSKRKEAHPNTYRKSPIKQHYLAHNESCVTIFYKKLVIFLTVLQPGIFHDKGGFLKRTHFKKQIIQNTSKDFILVSDRKRCQSFFLKAFFFYFQKMTENFNLNTPKYYL